MQRTLDQRQTTEQIRRNNNQNNADLLLSVYELTARSSLQIGQRPRQQSQSREKYKFKQCEQKKVDLMSISSPGSQKKLPLSPQLKLQSPREPGLIFNLIRAANNAIENNTDDKIIRTYMQIRTQVEMRLDVLESADSLAVQLEKIKQENDTLRKRVSDNINSQSLSNLAQLKMQLQKAEKKAESRKVCIKKLYQLLDKSEKELELYKSGKKSAKTSFSKKNELNEILNGVYPKNKENLPETYEPLLLSLIKDLDQKNYEAIENLSKNNSLNGDIENEKNTLIQNSLKSFKLMCEQKEEILKYSVQICENNQDLWKKFLEIDLTCQKQISTLRQAISELETNIKSYYQYLNKIGHHSAQKFQDAYQFQGVIGDSIAKWLKQLGEIQEIINQRESEQYEFQQFQETLVMRLKEIIQNNKIIHKQNDFKGLLDAINDKLFNQSEEILIINKELNNTHIKTKQQIEELQNKYKLEFTNYELQLKNYKELYDQITNTNKDLLFKNESLQVEFNRQQTEFNRQTQISVSALQNKQQEILNLNEQTKKLKEDITKSQELKLTYNEQQIQINQLKKEIERLNQVILQNQQKSSQQEENNLIIIEQNKSEITRLHQLIIDLHSQIEQSDNQISLLKEAEQIIKDKINKDNILYQEKIKKFQEIISNKEIEHNALEEEYKAIQSQNIEFYSQQQQDQDIIKLMKKDQQKNQEQYEYKINEFIKLSEKQLIEIKDLSDKYQQTENEKRNQDEIISKLKKELLKQTNDHQKQIKILQDQQKQQQEILQSKLQSFERLNEQNQIIINEQKKLLHESQTQLQKVNLENEILLQNNNESIQSMKDQYELQSLELNQTKQVVLDQQELIQNQQLLYHDAQQESSKYKKYLEQQEIINKQNQSELNKTILDQINLINQLKSNLEALDNKLIEKNMSTEQLNQTLTITQNQIEQLKLESIQLNNTIEQNLKTIENLQSQLLNQQQQHEILIQKLQNEQQSISEQNNLEKESKILDINKQIQELQDQLQQQKDQYQNTIQQHSNQIKINNDNFYVELQQKENLLNYINSQMQSQIQKKDEEKQGLIDQIQTLESKITLLEQKNKDIYLQEQSNQLLYRQLIQQLETFQQESQNEQQKWKEQLQLKDDKIKTIEINYKSEIGKLNDQLKQVNQIRDQLEQDQLKLIDTEQIKDQELLQLKEQLKFKQNEIDSIDKLLNQRLQNNEELNGKFMLISKEMSLYKDQNIDLQQQQELNQKTISNLKQNINEQDQLINQLQIQIKDLESQMNLQLNEMVYQQQDLVKKQQQELDNNYNELNIIKNQNLELQNQNTEQFKQIQILREDIQNKDIQIQDFQNQIDQQHETFNRINNENKLKQEEIDNMFNLLKDREQEIQNQIQVLSNQKKLQEKLEQEFNEKLINLNQTSQEQIELKQLIQQMQVEKKNVTEELQQKNLNVMEILKNQQITYQQLNEQLSYKEKEIEEQGILIEQYQQQVLKLNEELTIIMEEKSQQNLKIHQMRTNIEKIQQDFEIKNIQLQNSDLTLENQKQEFECQLNELGNQNKELVMRLSELQEDNTDLIEQVRRIENECRLKIFEIGEKNRIENQEQNKINQILQQELSIQDVSEENVINALSQIKNEFQELLDKQSQYSTLIFQLYSELLTDDEEEDVEKQIQVISNEIVGLIDIRDKYKKIQNEFEGEGDILMKIKELKQSEQKKQSSNAQDIKSIEAYSQLLDGLMQEFLHNRVNLTMQSMKSLLTEQQRQNVNEYRKKIGELQNKLLQAEKQQKCIDDTKFNLQQYQQIVDKSEQKAMYYEMECKKLVQQIQEMKQRIPQRISLNDLDQDQSEQHSLNILNFSLRQEILYGDDSFFDNISQIQDDDIHKKCQQQIFHLVEECQLLQEQLNMQKEDKNAEIK